MSGGQGERMKIAVGSESMAYETKEIIKQYLTHLGYQVVDVGTTNLQKPVSHITAAENVTRLIRCGECRFGILLCRTGAGISIAANKQRGVRCVLCESRWTAYSCRKINDANVLAMGSDVVTPRTACDMVKFFLQTPFADGESNQRRDLLTDYLQQLKHYETKLFENG